MTLGGAGYLDIAERIVAAWAEQKNPGLPENRPRSSPAKKISGEGGEILGGEHLAAIFVGKAFGEVRGEPCAECASTREIWRMTLEEITSALKLAETPPVDALRAGLAEADQLAPTVFALVDKLCGGIYLLPEESRLLHYGLTVLAAAKQAGLFPYVLKLTRQPEEELEQLFPHHISDSLARLLLSAWDGNSEALFAAIEDNKLVSEVRSAWFDVLARLTFDGVIPREQTLAFLTRLEREGAIEDGDMAWWGWEEAVIRLGATELEPALKRVWSKVVFDQHTHEENAESLARLHRAASDPVNPVIFDEDEVRAISDPVEALAWIEHRKRAMEAWEAEDSQPDDDPAQSIRLTSEESGWLSGFLASQEVPETATPFETLDGFLTALVIGPELVMPSVYLREIWGTEDGTGPIWGSQEQLQYFMELLTKHWIAIAARRNAGVAFGRVSNP